MSKYFNTDDAYDSGTLHNWYIDSVSDNDTPKWTEQHLDELEGNFYIFPKDTKPADVAPIVHGHWIDRYYHPIYACDCGNCSICGIYSPTTNYCPNCGAKMDLKESEEE